MSIVHIISALTDGGAEAVLYQLCLSDKSSNHIVISLMDDNKYGPLLTDNGIEVYYLNMKPNRISVGGVIKLYKIIRKIKPDVVQTWMIHADFIGGIISRLAGISNVVWGVHHTDLVKGELKRSTIIIAKMNAIFSHFVPKKIIYCAEKSRLVQESIGFNRTKGVVVPNGYNISNFTPSDVDRISFREELGIGDEVLLIGHVGRYVPQKDYKNLIEAIANIEQQGKVIKVVLVGSNLDIANKKLIDLIKEHNLINEFILLGRRNDIPTVMNGFDLFVLSSSSEAFPNVLNEAMACGTPCVTTDVGDSAVIVGNTGWVVPTKDPMSLANAIIQAIDEKLLRNEQWNERKIECRNRIIDNFSLENMISNYHKIWKTSLCVE
jgi:glycosyltransferase involved in cell wall biosynthesis